MGAARVVAPCPRADCPSNAASLAALTDPDPGVRLTTGPLSAELLAAHYVHDVQRLLTEIRQERR